MRTHSFALPHPSKVKAADQLSKTLGSSQAVQPLPPGSPGRMSLAQLGVTDPGRSNPLRLFVVGDDGGIVTEDHQLAVVSAMTADLAGPFPALFQHHLGDRVYYNGDADQFVPQFYEPRAHFPIPVVGPPGNHDGDPDPTISDPTQTGIATYMANFCTALPVHPPGDPDLEYGRTTTCQPWCDFTLTSDAAWFSNIWSNVPSGGRLQPSQLQWLAGEGHDCPVDALWIVSAHHPCFSVDAYHGGSAGMLAALDGVWKTAGREPDAVWAGHVHDVQCFLRTMASGKVIPYWVVGNSGYRNLHALAGDYTPGMDLGGGVVCKYADASQWGYLRVEIADGTGSYEYVGVGSDGSVAPNQFSIVT